jgi:C1A family cysteine protease
MGKYKYLLKEDGQDLRDYVYHGKSIKTTKDLPEKVDLREKMSPVVDQGKLGSCTANALASGLREYLEIASGESLILLAYPNIFQK